MKTRVGWVRLSLRSGLNRVRLIRLGLGGSIGLQVFCSFLTRSLCFFKGPFGSTMAMVADFHAPRPSCGAMSSRAPLRAVVIVAVRGLMILDKSSNLHNCNSKIYNKSYYTGSI